MPFRRFALACSFTIIAALGSSTFARAQDPEPEAAAAIVPVTLRWTAPGDDGGVGRAAKYDIRYSMRPLTNETFFYAIPMLGEPAPAAAGSAQTFHFLVPIPKFGWYFAIRTMDSDGNWSEVSNIAYLPPDPSMATPIAKGETALGLQPLTLSFTAPWPNPTSTAMRCAFTLPQPSQVQIDVFDAAGRHVRNLANGDHLAGREELTWDLRDTSGRPTEAGVFLIRARIADRTWTQRVSVIR